MYLVCWGGLPELAHTAWRVCSCDHTSSQTQYTEATASSHLWTFLGHAGHKDTTAIIVIIIITIIQKFNFSTFFTLNRPWIRFLIPLSASFRVLAIPNFWKNKLTGTSPYLVYKYIIIIMYHYLPSSCVSWACRGEPHTVWLQGNPPSWPAVAPACTHGYDDDERSSCTKS